MLQEFKDLEDHCLLKVDFSNAFNECKRVTFLNGIKENLPELFGWVQYCYATPSELRFGEHQILSSSGAQQGDPLGPLLFSLTLKELLKSFVPPPDNKSQLWYLDDGAIIGPRVSVNSLLTFIDIHGPQHGLTLNRKKCEVFWPSGDPDFPEFPPEVLRPHGGITLLGSPLWGPDKFIASQVPSVVDKVMEMQSKILELEDPEVETHLLRSCLGVCKANHILRTVPKHIISEQLQKFDDSLRSSLSRIIHSTIPDHSWQQASLPFRLGGFGIRKAMDTADAAFIASCNATRSSIPAVTLVDLPAMENLNPLAQKPGEQAAKTYVASLITNAALETPSQSNLQADLDQLHFDTLKSTLSIRDRVRLQTLAENNQTSAWLRATPLNVKPRVYNISQNMVGDTNVPHYSPPVVPMWCHNRPFWRPSTGMRTWSPPDQTA